MTDWRDVFAVRLHSRDRRMDGRTVFRHAGRVASAVFRRKAAIRPGLERCRFVTAQVNSRSVIAEPAMNSTIFAFSIILIAIESIWEREPFQHARKRTLRRPEQLRRYSLHRRGRGPLERFLSHASPPPPASARCRRRFLICAKNRTAQHDGETASPSGSAIPAFDRIRRPWRLIGTKCELWMKSGITCGSNFQVDSHRHNNNRIID